MFVGDGINDTVAMQTAAVGVAVASGSDIATATGDIILLNNDLKNYVLLLLVLPVQFYVGLDFYKGAYAAIKKQNGQYGPAYKPWHTYRIFLFFNNNTCTWIIPGKIYLF